MHGRRYSEGWSVDALYDLLLGSIRAMRARDRDEPSDPAQAREWIENNLWIRTKDRRVIPLRFNCIQEAYWSQKTDRDIILKYRQGGISTVVLAGFFEDTARRANTTSLVVAHDADSTEKLFFIVRLFYDHLPDEEKARLCRRPERPEYKNRRELYFDRINSWFAVGTAGATRVGRSQTISNLHCSEVAFWNRPDEVVPALFEAVPHDGRIVLESTANGYGNEWHAQWLRAKEGDSAFRPHLFPWFIHEEYRLPLDPGEILEPTGEERKLVARYGLDLEQLKWRREKVRTLRDKFLQEYPEDDVTCFLVSGRCVFEVELLKKYMAGCREPLEVQENGRLKIWAPPEEGRQYAVGADVAEGLEKNDYSAAYVIDRETQEDVAALHGHWPPDVFGRRLAALARRYNLAEIAVERNNHGHSVLNTLVNEEKYPKLYRHEDYDPERRERRLRLGWPTNEATKPLMIDHLDRLLRAGIPANDAGFVRECLSFVRRDDGSMGADGGCFDDRVMARAIAHQVAARKLPERWVF